MTEALDKSRSTDNAPKEKGAAAVGAQATPCLLYTSDAADE